MTSPISAQEMRLRVQRSLKGGPFECTSIVPLTGGTANFVYRGDLLSPIPGGVGTIIIKHSEGYVASAPGFKITAERCAFENIMLSALVFLLPTTHHKITVHTPRPYDFEKSTNTQIHSDLPNSLNLKAYALQHNDPDNLKKEEYWLNLGHALGLALKNFHLWAAAPEQFGLRDHMKMNKDMGELKFEINYSRLLATIEKFPDLLEGSRGVFEEVVEEMRETLRKEGGQLIHGDFWTGNILLPNKPQSTPNLPINLYWIDWELSHLSLHAFDIGQMLAEIYLLHHFKSVSAAIPLITSFLTGYKSPPEASPVTLKPPSTFQTTSIPTTDTTPIPTPFRVLIHIGCHFICWGARTGGWGDEEQVRGIVEIGRDFVTKGSQRDGTWFQRNYPVFGGVFNGKVMPLRQCDLL